MAKISNWGKGLFGGFLLIVISFVLTYSFANQVEHSATIADLELQAPESAVGFEGMVKIQGEPIYSNIVVTPFSDSEALYFTYLEEDYAVREIEKTRTITEEGVERTETYLAYEAEWKTVDSYTKWSSFSLGEIAIGTDSAKTKLNTTDFYQETIPQDYELSNLYGDVYSQENLVNVVQQVRYSIIGVAAEGQELIVVGSVSGNKIASGEEGTFFISNMTDAELQESQASTEQMNFWLMAVGAWLLMTAGFTMFFGPITSILNILPGLGDLVKGVLAIAFGIISAVIVFVAYVGFKYWWLILLVLLVIGALVLRKAGNKK
ncbi:MAG: hypothetical protein ACI9QC_000190 [Oceanicoccus sp.]|jgi:hypothetical protein